jgi:ankyrin repeat protein
VRSEGWTALHHAIANGHFSASEVLLESGANANRRHLGTLPAFTFHGAQPVLRRDWSCLPVHSHARSAVRAGKRTPLHEAVQRDDVEAVKLLMKHGAEITATNRSKRKLLPEWHAIFSRYLMADALT